MPFPIADLHCDLLNYLEVDPERTPFDEIVRCSVPQLKEGNVKVQVLAIFTPTEEGSSQSGGRQADIFKVLSNEYPDTFEVIQGCKRLDSVLESEKIGLIAAIENGSVFAEEDEGIEVAIDRFRMLFGKVGRPLYISLTWNHENRFAGGALTDVGLKEDGVALLNFIHQKQIAVDLSHASDQTAEDIFTLIDREKLEIPVIASHSNLREIYSHPRNLPDEFAKEIIRRKGVIGMNFVRSFIGEAGIEDLARHISRGLELGGESALCFGADFFNIEDAGNWNTLNFVDEFYFDEWGDASVYGRLLSNLRDALSLSDTQIEKLAFRNFQDYLRRTWQ